MSIRKRAMSENVFERKYRPVSDEDGCVSKELEEVAGLDEHYVWTCVEGGIGDATYLLPGFHHVNRINYVQTEVPWTAQDEADGLVVKWD